MCTVNECDDLEDGGLDDLRCDGTFTLCPTTLLAVRQLLAVPCG